MRDIDADSKIKFHILLDILFPVAS